MVVVGVKSKEQEMKDLLRPHIQIFKGDDYHLPDENVDYGDSEMSREVRKIRRRYADLYELREAQNLYESYMASLVEKYGGPKKFELASFLGHIHEYIPPYPRMKSSKKNRLLSKYNLVVSTKLRIPDDLEDRIAELVEDNDFFEPVILGKKDRLSKKEVKMIVKGEDLRSREELRNLSNMDYLEQYFMHRAKNKDKKDDKEWEPTLSDYLSDNVEFVSDEPDPNEIIYHKGQWMARKDVTQLNIFDSFGEGGWDSYKVLRMFQKRDKSNSSKRLTSLYKTEKKMKKKSKKKSKNSLKDQMDNFLVSVSKNNGYNTFEEFEDDMMDFTFSNLG